MKIVCDCKTEMEFKEDKDETPDSEGYIHVRQERDKIEVLAEHDEAWIECKGCGKKIKFFT